MAINNTLVKSEMFHEYEITLALIPVRDMTIRFLKHTH